MTARAIDGLGQSILASFDSSSQLQYMARKDRGDLSVGGHKDTTVHTDNDTVLLRVSLACHTVKAGFQVLRNFSMVQYLPRRNPTIFVGHEEVSMDFLYQVVYSAPLPLPSSSGV